jgi:large subunit ribosomal protein L13
MILQGKYKIDIISNNSINPRTMTKFLKSSELNSDWFEIDAKNAVVGRLASIIAMIVRGKNKTTFTPHMDDGDFVVVKNVEQAKFTGKKFKDKKYYRHTGHPGGIKEITPEKLLEKNKPGEILKLAIKRMLPGGVLGRKQLTKVKIYAGEEHPHAAQNPKLLDLGKLNNKNLIRN